VDYARQLGGIAATIEHRYFGLSTPFGPNQSFTPEGLKYLTLDNIMDDAVEFIRQIQGNVSGAASSRAIVASGSYGAFLATAFRLNRPESFYGAIAAAPPTNVFITADGIVPRRFDWWNWVRNYSHSPFKAPSLC
jgi:lysosomal Pro-X carboxypeptidase